MPLSRSWKVRLDSKSDQIVGLEDTTDLDTSLDLELVCCTLGAMPCSFTVELRRFEPLTYSMRPSRPGRLVSLAALAGLEKHSSGGWNRWRLPVRHLSSGGSGARLPSGAMWAKICWTKVSTWRSWTV